MVLNFTAFYSLSNCLFKYLKIFLSLLPLRLYTGTFFEKYYAHLINHNLNPFRMKKTGLMLLVVGLFFCLTAQTKYSTFYYQRTSLFEKLSVNAKDIIFLGNSITNGAEWAELFQNKRVKNRGISGDICQGVYDRLTPITAGKPSKIFLMIGINDMARGTSIDSIADATLKIIKKIQSESPRTRIYLQSILPVNDSFGMFQGHMKRKADIKPLNGKLEQLSKTEKITFIDFYSHFVIPDTELMNPAYTNDGLHLTGEGYLKWVEIMKPFLKAKK